MQGLRRAGMLGEHLDAAAQPADEVAGGEEGSASEATASSTFRVAEGTAHVASGDDLERAGVGVNQDQDAAGRSDEGAVQA